MALSLDLARLGAAYAAGGTTPLEVIDEILRRIAAAGDNHVWISLRPAEDLRAEAKALAAQAAPARGPLYGIPFAVKDNIDAAPLATTAACPAFAYQPAQSAPVVARLVAAGAILIGKTNLDQFATGLVGVRSPYGTPRNPFDPAMAPGGSSSGSAVAVAAGLVSFALGTDTAGSGRVPAAFNNLVGLKPTRGLISTRGVVPACRSLDCVSIFALTVSDARAVLAVAAGFDAADPYSRAAPPGFSLTQRPPARFRFGVPAPAALAFHGDPASRAVFEQAIAHAVAAGGEAEEIDFTHFAEAAALLYGPWVAERSTALRTIFAENPEGLHPVTREIVGAGFAQSAIDLFAAQHRLAALRQATAPLWQRLAFLLVPSVSGAFSLAEIAAEPIATNSELGRYTNFTNLLDLAAIAIPGGFSSNGFPAGVTLIAPAFHDGVLAAFAERMQRDAATPLGATGHPQPAAAPAPEGNSVHPEIEIAVFGAHLAGEALNPALVALGGRFCRPCRTAPRYRMLALPGAVPRPGLVPVGEGGAAIAGEIWALPSAALAALLAGIAPPLGLGTVELEGGRPGFGFICEAGAAGEDITRFGGWRAWREARR
ncbi:MAG: allophanate hydrolase [Acidibrevibacterium sp.]|uniref:allophanate hydrolase n=1 Tax=Acidibrevibacterium sp. TaxID=2606776 RepID=UPI003CFF0F71